MNIALSDGAKKSDMIALLKETYAKSAAVRTEEDVVFEPTEKPTNSYSVTFQTVGIIEINAEDDKAAAQWVESYVDFHWCPLMPCRR